MFSSCVNDDSMLDEIKLKEFSVDGILENYSVKTGFDVLKINPTLTSSEDSNFKYYWYHYTNNVLSGQGKYDTISTELNLNYPVTLKPNSYTLIFCVEDVETGVKDFTETQLFVETTKSRGWYVLKHKDNSTDFDLFNSTGKASDVFSSVNGRSLSGNAKQIGWMDVYSWGNPETNILEKDIRTLALLSDNDFSMMRIEDSKELNQLSGMYVDGYNGPVAPNFFLVGGGTFYFANNSKVSSLRVDGSDSGRFGYDRIADHDYELSDHALVSHRNHGPIVHDKKHHTLYWVPSNSTELKTFGVGTYPTENMDSDPIYMGYQLAGSSTGKGYMLLQNRTTPSNLQIAELDMYAAYQYGGSSIPLIVDLQSVPMASGLVDAENFALNKGADLLYFTKDNVLSFYNMQNKSEEVIYTFGAGEHIDFIEHIVHDDNYRVSTPEPLDFNKLVIATSMGGNYKVYVFGLQTGKPVGTPEIMEGTGTVGDVMYVSPHAFRYEFRN
jgi:hypothetical protein